MKLFAKIFLCTSAVLSIALSLSGYLMISSSFKSAMARETERAMDRYQIIKFTLQASLITTDPDSHESGLPDLQKIYTGDNINKTAVFSEDRTLLYSELPPDFNFNIIDGVSRDMLVYRAVQKDGAHFLIVCGQLTQSGKTLYLMTAADITSVIAQKDDMEKSFIRVYFITLGISMLIMLILSNILTLPIKKLTRSTARIAKGQYGERLSPYSDDEIGELSSSFNLMAEAIENQINMLSMNARQKEDFMANFAHELKTPLTSVIGYADMLYQKKLPRETVKSAAWYILNEGMRIEALSLKLLELIVLERRDFILEEISAEELVQNITETVRPLLAQKQIILYLNIKPAFIKIEYDLFKTLFLNLIDNAVKAGGTKIKLLGDVKNGNYRFCIIDNGRGIPKNELARITEAFYMVDKSRSREQHGAGLGLALVSKITEIHNGKLVFDSIEGRGTIVKIELPLFGEGSYE